MSACRPPQVPADTGRLVVDAKVDRARVVAAFAAGIRIESPQGRDLSDLHCPHCYRWLGDPSDPVLAHVSRTARDHRAECRSRRRRP